MKINLSKTQVMQNKTYKEREKMNAPTKVLPTPRKRWMKLTPMVVVHPHRTGLCSQALPVVGYLFFKYLLGMVQSCMKSPRESYTFVRIRSQLVIMAKCEKSIRFGSSPKEKGIGHCKHATTLGSILEPHILKTVLYLNPGKNSLSRPLHIFTLGT